MHVKPLAIALVAAATAPVIAQVTSDCNPIERTDCTPNPAFGTTYSFDLATEPSTTLWTQTVRGVEFDSDNGAIFTINKEGDSPTLRTAFYMFWGRTELHVKCAGGTGIVSSAMWLSDTLDEIDFEMLGSKNTLVASNFFGKGVNNYTNGVDHTASFDVQSDYHNYTTVWTADKLEWWINGALVRTLLPTDKNAGSYYPQTPMRLSLGIWAGGDPDMPDGTRQWAGGDTDYTKAPFTMYVKNVTITDYSTGAQAYTYKDQTGSASSINIVMGTSDSLSSIQNGRLTSADDNVQTDTGPTLGQSASSAWSSLSSTSKIAIIASSAGAVGLIGIAAGFFCWRQRSKGRKQAAIAEAQWSADRRANEDMRKAGINPDGLTDQATEYDPRSLASEKGFIVTGETYVRSNSLVDGNSLELQPQASWDPTTGNRVVGGNDATQVPRSPPRSLSTVPIGSAEAGGFDYPAQSPGPTPRSFMSPRQQYDGYTYGRL